MATRDTPAHYEPPTKAPPKGSLFEYLWHGLHLLDLQLEFPLWWRPLPLPGNEDLDVVFERANFELVLAEAGLEAHFVAKLRAAGVAEDLLVKPYPPQTREIIEALLNSEHRRRFIEEGYRADDALAHLRGEYNRRDLKNRAYRRSLTVRTLISTEFFLGEHRPKGVYDFLNTGLRVDQNGKEVDGLDRHALRSAWRTFRSELEQKKDDRLVQLRLDVEKIRALVEMREKSLTENDLRHLRPLRGKALVYGLYEALDVPDEVFRSKKAYLASLRQKADAVAV